MIKIEPRNKVKCKNMKHKMQVIELAMEQGFSPGGREGVKPFEENTESLFLYFNYDGTAKIITQGANSEFYEMHAAKELTIPYKDASNTETTVMLKEGDAVFCKLYGNGAVSAKTHSTDFCFSVQFDSGVKETYDKYGRMNEKSLPTLMRWTDSKCVWVDNKTGFYNCSTHPDREWIGRFNIPDFCPHCGKLTVIEAAPYLLGDVEVSHPVAWKDRDFRTDFLVVLGLNDFIPVVHIPLIWAHTEQDMRVFYDSNMVRRSPEEAKELLGRLNQITKAEHKQ